MDKQQAKSAMNESLCDFASRWKMDGDYLRCVKCKRPMIASRTDLAFSHADGCKNAPTSEPHPWLTLMGILRPIMTPSPGVDAAEQKPCAYRRWDDSNSRWHFTLWPEEEQQFQWSPVFAAPSPAASAIDPHPPTRHCMCADCKPSFEPDQGWWEQEAERLVEALALTWDRSIADMSGARAALLAHLRTKPSCGGANG